MPDETPSAPVLRVVRGYPSPEELAAVVAVMAAASHDSTANAAQPQRSSWANPARSMRRHFQPHPGHLTSDSWWLSGLPQ